MHLTCQSCTSRKKCPARAGAQARGNSHPLRLEDSWRGGRDEQQVGQPRSRQGNDTRSRETDQFAQQKGRPESRPLPSPLRTEVRRWGLATYITVRCYHPVQSRAEVLTTRWFYHNGLAH